jgi:hypothetical protein
MRRALFVTGWLCLSLLGALAVAQTSPNGGAAEPRDKILGTWKSVSGSDDSEIIKIESETNGGVKISFGCKQDGSCPRNIIANYDGKLYKYSNYSDAAKYEASFQKTGDRTIQQDWYLNGKQGATYTWQLSPDGNTLRVTSQMVSPPGSKKITSVHERSGGPTSNDISFVGFWKRDRIKDDAVFITYATKGALFTFTDAWGVAHDRNCDGKDHLESASLAGSLYSCRFPDDHTYELTAKANGKVLSITTRKVSEDGKTMFRASKDAEGKTISEEKYEKIN